MGRMYTAIFKSISVTVAQDFFEVLAATGKPVIIHGFSIAQSSDVSDAAEEMLVVVANRGVGAVTSGSGGSTVTPQPIDDGEAAATAVVERNNTSAMSPGSGSIEELEAHIINIRVPYTFWYTPETRPVITPGNRWALELETVPADALVMSGTLWFQEIG